MLSILLIHKISHNEEQAANKQIVVRDGIFLTYLARDKSPVP
jgi:hypothetical protein